MHISGRRGGQIDHKTYSQRINNCQQERNELFQ